MSIPLIQKPEKDDINTSIIAIKRNIERINMLLGLSNSEEIDTSKFATKEELQQAVTDLQPVDEVTSGNMQSVTSNAVANACPRFVNYGTIIHTGIPNGGYTASEDCYFEFHYVTCQNVTTSLKLRIDNNIIATDDSSTITNTTVIVYILTFSGYIKKGQTVTFERAGASPTSETGVGTFFKLLS